MKHDALRRRLLRLASIASLLGLVAFALAAPTAMAARRPHQIRGVTVRRGKIRYLGKVNVRKLMRAEARRLHAAKSAQAPVTERFKIVDPALRAFHKHPGTLDLSGFGAPITTSNVPGESGFAGLNGEQQAVVNGNLDLEPPDQGLCVGQGDIGEFINNALTFYDPNGIQLENTIPAYALFKQPRADFFSDPRCYYDAPTQRWILTEFIVGTSTKPSIQFLAVSNSPDPLGTYTIWQIPTTDAKTSGCPCFGDFDQVGIDDNGIYISTNEFGNEPPFVFNGVIIYAVSKQLLETFSTTGIPPTVFRYRLPTDYFGQPYHIPPSATPAGASYAPDTEYFVESNGDAIGDNHLAVYAMTDTSLLAQPAPPPLSSTEVTTEPYAQPPDATQKGGPIPLGVANQDPEGQLQADFDAIQEVTYVGGQLYAELDTVTAKNLDGVDWFEIAPTITSKGTVTAKVTHQGLINAPGQNLIYPVIALDSAGNGYIAATLSGPGYFPSASYIAFTPTGPTGPIHIAALGATPEDSFTCYAAFVGPNYGGCRWGDYSMGAASGSQVYMATEYVPPTSRDYLTNWGTFVWHAPAPAAP